MNGLKELLRAEQMRLEQIIQKTRKQLESVPEGSLRVSKSQNCPQFYHCTEEKKYGTYISKSNKELIRKLAQKSYDEKILKLAEKRLVQIKKLARDYEDNEIENIYESEHLERQKFIIPVETTWLQRFEMWKNTEFKGKEFQEGVPVIMTERGERVRSKSEKIMADYFFRRGIEYKYECPIYLKGLGMVYPDFTFLSKKSGMEIYWEHNGMMDEPVYARKAVQKIHSYENNGIYVGERLILTYETDQMILSTRQIESLVNKYLV